MGFRKSKKTIGWEMRIGKNLGWEMGFKPPLQDPPKSASFYNTKSNEATGLEIAWRHDYLSLIYLLIMAKAYFITFINTPARKVKVCFLK